MRVAIFALVMLGAVTAHADPATKLAKKRGWKHAQLLFDGDYDLLRADKGDMTHWLLVDTAKKKVLDLGVDEGKLRVEGTTYRLTTDPFLGVGGLIDAVVSFSWSNGMGGTTWDWHYVVRTKKLQLACSFGGNSSSAMEDASESSTVTITKTSDQPLTWEVATKTNLHHAGMDEPQPDQTRTFTLGKSGRCK
jgi:hypothetical protein